MRHAIFPVHVSKAARLPRKSSARSYEVLHLSRKIILANLKIWCSKMQHLSGNQRADLLTSLINMSLVLRLPTKCILIPFKNVPRLPSSLEMLQNPHVFLTFGRVQNPLRLPHKTALQRPKVARTCVVFSILNSKCASRHNPVHLFNSSASKSGLRPSVFCTNFWPPHANVLRAEAVCNFSTSQLPKVVRTWCVLYILTSKSASRRNGVQFFISHLAIWFRTRRPSEPTFSTLRSHKSLEKHGKYSVSRLFYLFTALHLPSSDSFFSLIFSLLLFSSLTLPTSAFPSVHIVESLTCKLASIILSN